MRTLENFKRGLRVVLVLLYLHANLAITEAKASKNEAYELN